MPEYPNIRRFKRQPCLRYRGHKNMLVDEESRLAHSKRRCYRLSCEGCWRLEVLRRALDLKKAIEEEADQVWYGIVPSNTRSAISTYKGRNDGIKATTATYHATDQMTVIASANVTPTFNYLQQMTVAQATWQWLGYGIEYRLKKMYSDWEWKSSSNVSHIISGPDETVNQIADVCRVHWGQEIEDFDTFWRKANRIAHELSEGEDDYP